MTEEKRENIATRQVWLSAPSWLSSPPCAALKVEIVSWAAAGEMPLTNTALHLLYPACRGANVPGRHATHPASPYPTVPNPTFSPSRPTAQPLGYLPRRALG